MSAGMPTGSEAILLVLTVIALALVGFAIALVMGGATPTVGIGS